MAFSPSFTELDIAMVWVANLSDGRIALLANTPYLA
jgi:hypothetical protein